MNYKLIFTSILLLACLASCMQSNKQLLDKGLELSKQKKYDEAIKLYSQVITNNNKLQIAYYNRGFCYFKSTNYSKALADFDTIIALHIQGGYIISYKKSSSAASEEVQGEVDYNDALYERAQVKYYMDSVRSSFNDFQLLIDNNYKERSNCLLWQGALWIKGGENDSACYYFNQSRQYAITTDDKQQADKMMVTYCNNSAKDSSLNK